MILINSVKPIGDWITWGCIVLVMIITYRNGDIPVEESFYETVASDSSKTLPQKQGAALSAASSNTMPSPNMSKKLV